MHLVSDNTLSGVVMQAFDKIINEGHYRSSRNGGCSSIFDVTFEIKNPRSRHLHLLGRKSNIFALIAETFWVMAGDDRVDPYLSFFLPRAPQYSDDGLTWSGAYGPRMYAYKHLSSVPGLFRRDTKYTRRAYIPIHDPAHDSTQAIENKFGAGELGKDRPCNLGINFYVMDKNTFTTKVTQRSGDIVFGTGSINPFEFSFLHELMYNEIKKDYPDLELGPYRWHVTNCHLYDFTYQQAEDVLKLEHTNRILANNENHMPLVGPEISKWQPFFRDLVEQYTEAIEAEDPEYVCGSLVSHLGHTFIEYGVPIEDNLLWLYVVLVARYITSKRGVTIESAMPLSGLYGEVTCPIVASSFRKFDVRV